MKVKGYVVLKATRHHFTGYVIGGKFKRALSSTPTLHDDEIAIQVTFNVPDNVFDPYVVDEIDVPPRPEINLDRTEVVIGGGDMLPPPEVVSDLWDEAAGEFRDPRQETY